MATEEEIPISVLKQYFRVPTGLLLVDYPGRPMWLDSSISNLSISGAFIRTSAPLPVDQVVELTFQLPNQALPLKVKAKVRWSQKKVGLAQDPQGMGVAFINLGTRETKLLNDFVETFLRSIRSESK